MSDSRRLGLGDVHVRAGSAGSSWRRDGDGLAARALLRLGLLEHSKVLGSEAPSSRPRGSVAGWSRVLEHEISAGWPKKGDVGGGIARFLEGFVI